MGWIHAVGFGALGVLAVGWLVVSFSEPGPRRSRVEWLSATALFLALVSLFVNLVSKALEEQSRVSLVAFGFLLVVFCSGLVVSAVQTVLALRGEHKAESSATH